MQTWYGWNLASHRTIAFYRAVTKKRAGKRYPAHPWFRVAWGGLWKPMSVKRGSRNRYRWHQGRP